MEIFNLKITSLIFILVIKEILQKQKNYFELDYNWYIISSKSHKKYLSTLDFKTNFAKIVLRLNNAVVFQ